jgi:hypothetical protein
VEVVSVLLSAGTALEARALVSAVRDDEMSDESESEFSIRITRHLCTMLVKEAMWMWSLCCCQLGLLLKLELR